MFSPLGFPSIAATCLLLVANAQLRVLGPDYLAKSLEATHGRIQGSTATFGAPFYGDRVLGRLVYGESKGHHHCEDTDYEVPALDVVHGSASTSHDQVRLINIIMVRRGECSFVTKVKVARGKGAHAVIIVDREDSSLTSHDLQNIIVADDGFGGRIRIPSILISKYDGESLMAAAKHEDVVVELSWDIPRGEVVALDLWMNSAAEDSQNFLKHFAESRKTLNEVVKFTPHYHVFSADPALSGYSGLCSDSSARYCAEDPDGAGPVSGKDILEEDVRQLCMHEITKVPRSRQRGVATQAPIVFYAEKWWNYVEKLPLRCPIDAQDNAQRFGKACSEKLMEEVGMSSAEVDRVRHCVETTSNAKLESELVNKAWSPRALRVNGWRYSGTLEADLVTRAVCSGFVTQPEECKNLLKSKPRDPLDVEGGEGSGISMGVFLSSAFVLVAAAFCILMLYRRFLENRIGEQIRKEVEMEVRGQIGEYAQI